MGSLTEVGRSLTTDKTYYKGNPYNGQPYAITINPSCFKKLDHRFVNQLISVFLDDQVGLRIKNYNNLVEEDQILVLRAITAKLQKSLNGSDWSVPVLEYTKKKNAHYHMYFRCKSEPFDQFYFTEAIEILNKQFSSGINDPAIFIEQTEKQINYWEHYMKKDEITNFLMKLTDI